MKLFKIFLLFIIPSLAFTTAHKYYVSITSVEYIADKQEVQIITRIFVDDFERLLRERYDSNFVLTGIKESPTANKYITKYLNEKLQITINNKPATLKFIGKEYDVDIMICYLLIDNIESIKTLTIENQVLFDLFEDQQNIIRINIYDTKKSVLLTKDDNKRLLNFK